MLLKKLTFAMLIASASFVFSCSSKETTEAYDKYYGSGSKERVEAALAKQASEANTSVASDVATTAAASDEPKRKTIPADVEKLLNEHICFSCHRPYDKLIGPSYYEVAKKGYSVERIIALVHTPEPDNWPGYPPMAPMPQVPTDDLTKIATWINSLAE